jgi:hypothetical protein
MFGLGKRDERAVDAVREEMNAADSRARAVLANAMAQIEARLSNDHTETARLQETTQAAIESLRHEVAIRPSDLGPVLEQVAAMCALVAERLEADRLERRALTEAITLLARPGLMEGPSRVMGGTVMASSEISLDEHPAVPEGPTLDQMEIAPIESVAIEHAPIVHEPIDLDPVEARAATTPTVDVEPPPSTAPAPVDAPAFIDLTEDDADATEPASGAEIWNAFEKRPVDEADAEEELDLRPRQGTRLTAARRSNAGASYR